MGKGLLSTHQASPLPSPAQAQRRRQEVRAQQPTLQHGSHTHLSESDSWHGPYRGTGGKGRGGGSERGLRRQSSSGGSQEACLLRLALSSACSLWPGTSCWEGKGGRGGAALTKTNGTKPTTPPTSRFPKSAGPPTTLLRAAPTSRHTGAHTESTRPAH